MATAVDLPDTDVIDDDEVDNFADGPDGTDDGRGDHSQTTESTDDGGGGGGESTSDDGAVPNTDAGESDPSETEAAASTDAAATTEPAESGVSEGESFPPELLSAANLDEARARAAFGTPERLEQALLQHWMQAGQQAQIQRNQQRLQQLQQSRSQAVPSSNAAPPPGQPPAAAPQGAPTQEELEEYLRLKLELPENYADEADTRELFDALSQQVSKFYAPHLQRLEANTRQQQESLAYLLEIQQEDAVRRHDEEFDRFISELPDQWHELLGKDRPEIGTPAHEARAQLFHASQVLAMGQRQYGQQMPNGQRWNLALRSAFPNHHDTVIRGDLSAQRQSRSRIARPTHRAGAPPNPEEAAVQRVEKFLKDNNVTLGGDEAGPDEF